MSSNSQQITKLIDRLFAKTSDGSMQWRPVGPNSFEVRLGNFSISLRSSGRRNSLLGGTELLVTKLDGKKVASVSSSTPSSVRFSFEEEQIPDSYREKIDDLFDIINNRDADLDEIIKLLG